MKKKHAQCRENLAWNCSVTYLCAKDAWHAIPTWFVAIGNIYLKNHEITEKTRFYSDIPERHALGMYP